ncbi:phospholipid carrier-dependent glycosyltransferase [Sphingomonas qomolangmaensis]|uniref:Polyprenol-phosphate-mannose--protein mannosyltransferase n=1 Tax=Sphingomonas qomolangmaensis TaxID=2918765 RepID=A0ABY5LAJ0_9SPHN|nr:phospholipid carrier-dependent glycosyltransferase [Sphingomonas qomolangmaensis]UUL82819.1 phospholipid carrier-dependent glycosyltransferase [Sphingomonas qomolangmaensis]
MRLAHRPLLVALLIGLAAQALFSIQLGRPTNLVFDEVHYVPAARTMLALAEPANTEHPPLAKALIAIGIALFGDNPIGWRAMSTLAGTATVLGGFAILMLGFGRVRVAALGAYLLAINQTVFVQARIAMLDGFLGAFVTCGIAALLWAMRARPEQRMARIVLAGALLGCAVAVKWSAAPYVAVACLAVLLLSPVRPELVEGPSFFSTGERKNIASTGSARTGIGGRALAAVILGLTALAAYFATFTPAFFYARDALTLADLLPLQQQMYAQQTVVLRPHPYQSDWWSWPLMLRPIWYYYERDLGIMRGILLLGNPAIFWSGLVAVAACLGAGLRGSRAHLALALLWLFSIAIYVVIPKSLGFFYYYHLSGIFVTLAIPPALILFKRGNADLWFATAATAVFVYFYPIIAAAPLPNDQAFLRWMWFASWR